VDAFMPYLVRLSQRIAARLGEEVAPSGVTRVELLGAGAAPLPLADWRAVVWSSLPDETFVPVPGDPADAAAIRCALAPEIGPYNVLATDSLLVLPATNRDNRLRGVQCDITDPVSFAVCAGRETAFFPNVAGWSARDWARRAVAEHRAWLDDQRDGAELTIREWSYREARRAPAGLRALGRLLTAARAALFLESLDANAPVLPLTAAVTARLLDADDVYAEYATARADGRAPEPDATAALREAVFHLPAYGEAPARPVAAA
jgi:hypothetical protein